MSETSSDRADFQAISILPGQTLWGHRWFFCIAVEPFRRRVAYEVLELQRPDKKVLMSGKLDGTIPLKDLASKTQAAYSFNPLSSLGSVVSP